MKRLHIASICRLILAIFMLAVIPCAAAEEALNPLKTLPTEDCNLSAYKNANQSPLYGKSAVFFGDSICNASGDAQKGYAGRIGTKYSMPYYKEGVSGSAFAASGRSKIGTKINEFYQAHRDEAIDYVILEGGTNDAWDQGTLGTVSESFEPSSFNTNTFAGAVETAIYTAKKAFPSATVGFIIIYKMPIANWQGQDIMGLRDNTKMEPYMNTIIEACEKWEIPYLDLYHDAKFNNTVFKTNTKTYLSDGIHMNSNGYDLISKYIAAWMEDPIRKAPEPPVETPSIDLSDSTATDPSNEKTSENTETPPIDEPAPKSNTGKIIAIASGAAVGVAAITTGTILFLKKKKK